MLRAFANMDLATVQALASICAYCAAVVGVITAVRTLRGNRRNQRESNARRAYFDYTRRAEEKPEFAFPFISKIDFEAQTFNGSKKEFESYEWFLSSLLTTVMYLLETSGRNPFWRRMMILQLAYHWRYLEHFRAKKQFLITWDNELRGILDEGIAEGKQNFSRPLSTPQ